MWLIEVKTIFHWISSITHSFEDKKSYSSKFLDFLDRNETFLSISGENGSKHMKTLKEMYVVHFELKNSFRRIYFACLLKKKFPSILVISEVATV